MHDDEDEKVVRFPGRHHDDEPASPEDKAGEAEPEDEDECEGDEPEDDEPDDEDEGEAEPVEEPDDAAELVKLSRSAPDPKHQKLPHWPEPVDGEALFTDYRRFVSRFVVMPPHTDVLLPLWAIGSFAVPIPNALPCAPLMRISAATKESGKSRLLSVLAGLVFRANPVSGITEAGFVQGAHRRHTMLIDECDKFLPKRDETRSEIVKLLNASHDPTMAFKEQTRIVKGERIIERFNLYTFTALAGIGEFGPPTLRSRALMTVKLKKLRPGETVEPFVPADHAEAMLTLRRKAARWVLDNKDAIMACQPDLDPMFAMRARDNAIPILKIADTLSPKIGRMAREALHNLAGKSDVVDANEATLRDIAELFCEGQFPGTKAIFSAEIVEKLTKFYSDKELYENFSTKALNNRLRDFDIHTFTYRDGDAVQRAYRRHELIEWFEQYGLAYEPEPEPPTPKPPQRGRTVRDPAEPPASATVQQSKDPDPTPSKLTAQAEKTIRALEQGRAIVERIKRPTQATPERPAIMTAQRVEAADGRLRPEPKPAQPSDAVEIGGKNYRVCEAWSDKPQIYARVTATDGWRKTPQHERRLQPTSALFAKILACARQRL